MIIYKNIGSEINIFEECLLEIWYCFDNSTLDIKFLPFEKFKYKKTLNIITIESWIFSFCYRKIHIK